MSMVEARDINIIDVVNFPLVTTMDCFIMLSDVNGNW